MYNVLTKDGLIITGEQGVGKSILAKIIAASRGEYITALIDDFSGSRFSPAGIDNATTVIIEEFNPTPENVMLAKILAVEPRLNVNFKMREPFIIKMPHFIFVANAPLALHKDDRRFKVITLKSYAL